MDYDVIANQPVVIDNGSGVIKAGFAGEQQPKVRFANFVGRPKYHRVMAGGLEGDIFIGSKAESNRGLFSIEYPMEHGIVNNWSDMEKIWEYIFGPEQLQIFPEEHPVLLTDAPLNPLKNREKSAEIFFETFNVPALYIQMQAVLSLYATGRTTGVVLDSGDGVTHAVPIVKGFAMKHAIQRMDLAGRDVTEYLRVLLRREGYEFHRSNEFEIVREIKENSCYLASDPTKVEGNSVKQVYSLPDTTKVELSNSLFRAPEVLFKPDLIGTEWPGMAHLINQSIMKCDIDLRQTLYSNIVLSGGTTLFKGFGDRLLGEVRKIAPSDGKIRISASQERLSLTWIGGSIVASLDTFRKMWLGKKEYDDVGASALHKKFF
ncbi:Protein CBG03145 [Caenorhabditis briggsae]|uniref:Protein CBG03145 n=3 Tax=Caenorhabditis briggsae TaxID=6238 RepID=A8WSP3_CAEBR|nr:Protein CBG03145 [Caenorhabditis briggsae]UMM17658.1 hypothetical protein L5515_014097 [Caenorhabditis briggsae]CAP23502.1 Protein CBG03145 [Caenorhabditis briggsae]